MIPYLTEDIGKTSPAAATWTGAFITLRRVVSQSETKPEIGDGYAVRFLHLLFSSMEKQIIPLAVADFNFKEEENGNKDFLRWRIGRAA